MNAAEIQDYSRQLLAAWGEKAIPEAARKAVTLERSGHLQAAQDWRRIEAALMLMRGPRET